MSEPIAHNPAYPKLIATSDSTKWKLLHIRIVGDIEALMAGWVCYGGRWLCPPCRNPDIS